MSQDCLLLAYEALGDATPMRTDCGLLCGAACCRPDDDGKGGVFLFPGEADLIRDCSWARILPHTIAPVMICSGHCDRARRPLGCRIFPLSPVRDKNGRWTVRLDVRARPMCPLIPSGVGGMDPDFVRATRSALRIIAESSEGEAFLEKWQALEEAYRKPLW